MKQDLISIIIPIYNVEKYIKKCINSVIEQTHKNLEIICIDDRGNDASMHIVEEYARKDNRIKIIQNKKNMGLAPARNVGINAAKGHFIYFLDSDDYINIDTIESMYTSALKHNSDVVFSNVAVFLEDGLDVDIQHLKDYFKFKPQSSPEQITNQNLSFYLNEMPPVAWNKLYKTSFLKENNLLFINEKVLHEDEGFHVKVLSNLPKISFLNSIGLYYLIRENSIMREMERNRSKRMHNLNLSLKDATDYLLKQNTPKDILKTIKNSNIYKRKRKNRKRWLFTLKIKRNKIIFRLFGVYILNYKA